MGVSAVEAPPTIRPPGHGNLQTHLRVVVASG